MTLSIIIPSFNTRALTKNCLSSIFKFPPNFPFEVIVVDNASKDQSAEMINKSYPMVKVIANKENVGYAKANNQAAKVAKGKYLLLLNSDTILNSGILENMVNYLKTHSDVGAVTSKLVNPDGTTQYYYHRRFPTFFSFAASLLKNYFNISTKLAEDYFMLNEKFVKETDIEQAGGTVLMIPVTTIQKIHGLFDNRFPLFFNDTDLCLRIKKTGLKIILLPDVKVIHFRGKSTDLLDPFIIREELFVSMLKYFRKHKMYLSYFLAKVTLIPLLMSLAISTLLGLTESYLGAKAKNRVESLQKQFKILLSVILELPQISPFRQ